MKTYDKYELKRLKKRIRTIIYGDSSDDPSGLSLVQLRQRKSEFDCEYDSRKARLYEVIWRYEECLYDEISVSEKASNEVDSLIHTLWEKFIPEEGKSIYGYIDKSLERIINRLKKNQKVLLMNIERN